MPRAPSNPFAFAAEEAAAQGAAVGLVAWEVNGAVHYRVIPDGSVAVLVGLHELLAHAVDAATEPVADEDAASTHVDG